LGQLLGQRGAHRISYFYDGAIRFPHFTLTHSSFDSSYILIHKAVQPSLFYPAGCRPVAEFHFDHVDT
jgi:hypothetical protein